MIYGRNEAEHDKRLLKVVGILAENGFGVNEAKIQLRQKEVKLLGMIVNKTQ